MSISSVSLPSAMRSKWPMARCRARDRAGQQPAADAAEQQRADQAADGQVADRRIARFGRLVRLGCGAREFVDQASPSRFISA
jgi:hypothetical protein